MFLMSLFKGFFISSWGNIIVLCKVGSVLQADDNQLVKNTHHEISTFYFHISWNLRDLFSTFMFVTGFCNNKPYEKFLVNFYNTVFTYLKCAVYFFFGKTVTIFRNILKKIIWIWSFRNFVFRSLNIFECLKLD